MLIEIREQLIKHEGLRLKPYLDTVGKMTIGVGRNLDDNGISKEEALNLLDSDIISVIFECDVTFNWYKYLSNVRKRVIIDMVFNMGLPTFKGFKQTIRFLELGDFKKASKEMLNSKWAKQVGERSETLSVMMKTDLS